MLLKHLIRFCCDEIIRYVRTEFSLLFFQKTTWTIKRMNPERRQWTQVVNISSWVKFLKSVLRMYLGMKSAKWSNENPEKKWSFYLNQLYSILRVRRQSKNQNTNKIATFSIYSIPMKHQWWIRIRWSGNAAISAAAYTLSRLRQNSCNIIIQKKPICSWNTCIISQCIFAMCWMIRKTC